MEFTAAQDGLRVDVFLAGCLPELTRSSVVRADKVRKDLRNALAKGHYPNACMNEAETTLYLDETLYHPAPAAAPVQPTFSGTQPPSAKPSQTSAIPPRPAPAASRTPVPPRPVAAPSPACRPARHAAVENSYSGPLGAV